MEAENVVNLREYIEKIIELKFASTEKAIELGARELERRLEGLSNLPRGKPQWFPAPKFYNERKN